ncbi:MAG: hypothetical protein FWH33_07210 [Oscillospiraceae bacterium]|nr:hypothetical protein [Oscillospiraceae bacterium]
MSINNITAFKRTVSVFIRTVAALALFCAFLVAGCGQAGSNTDSTERQGAQTAQEQNNAQQQHDTQEQDNAQERQSTEASKGAEPLNSGDAEYEAQTILVEGLHELEGGIAEVKISELRALEQVDIQASYMRTTGMYEEFLMSGPRVRDVVAFAGGNIDDYEGFAIIGRDNYYCLFSKELLDDTPDLLLAVVIDGEAKLDADNAPARAAVPGQFGPYWVKQVAKIVLYEEIPKKDIKNVWVFNALTAGIEPYEYEYYGSKDQAIDLEQLFSRLDYVDSKAFFTMKSTDGFKKDEAMNMVKSRYYIKIDGEDAPTNVAPYIMLGMNVQRIAWISTNADAAVFPYMLAEYMDAVEAGGLKGIPLDEVLYEAGMETVRAAEFDLLGTAGERVRVAGDVLFDAVLVPLDNGGASVIWAVDHGVPDIGELLRIRRAEPTLEG